MDCFVLDVKACKSVRRLGASETWYPCDFFGMLHLDLICLEHCLNQQQQYREYLFESGTLFTSDKEEKVFSSAQVFQKQED